MASLCRKIGLSVLGILVVGIAGLAIAMSYDSACGPAPAPAAGATLMQAVMHRCYGPPEVLSLEQIEKPVPEANQILIRVHAASINPVEWHTVRGEPYMMRLGAGLGAPRNPRIGIDFSGTVEAVGKDITRFKPGDDVFGGKSGALAEYMVATATGSIAPKPARISHEQAAGVYVAALTSLQTLRDRAGVKPGQKVLINGASGGVGTFAVQIAKALGAEVTGVCSTRNVALVRSLGADRVIDYKKEDFTQSAERYDVIMDNVANRPILDIRRVLKPQGKYIVIGGGGPDTNPWVGAFIQPLKALVISWFVDQDMGLFISHASAEDIALIGQWIDEGKITPFVDRSYPLAEIHDAMRYLEEGHARGKVVLTMN